MEKMQDELKRLRKRFVSDTNLPIQVIQSPYFEDRLNVLEKEFGASTKYDNLLHIIARRFDNNINKFLDYYAHTRNEVIKEMTSTEAWDKFNKSDITRNVTKSIFEYRNLYTQEQDGGLFISFDMKKANFQTLKFIDKELVLGAETYEELIGMFTDLDYIKESKYTRQVIFGQMNPKRTIWVEKQITNDFAVELVNNTHYLNKLVDLSNFKIFSLNADEVIFKFDGNEEEFDKFNIPYGLNGEVTYKGVVFKFSKFKLHHRQFKLRLSNANLNVYEKEDYLDGHKRHLHCVPSHYYPQVYKLLNGMQITPHDTVFYYEHEICAFINSLELVK